MFAPIWRDVQLVLAANVVMRQGSVALQRIGGSKVRSSSHNNTVVESLLLVRNSRPTTGSSSTSTSRRVKLLVCFLLLLVGFQWFSENFASLGTVGLRTVVFPLVRPHGWYDVINGTIYQVS